MAGFKMASGLGVRADRRVAGAVCILAAFVIVGAGVDPAYAQAPAPIVYKSSGSAPVMTAALDLPRDGMSLNVAPHAPVPSFSKVPAAPTARPVSLGPVPPVSGGVEQSPALRTIAPPSAAGVAAPYAGPPYQVDGRWYVPAHEPNYDEVGIASWYGPNFHGKDSASGEPFDENAMTAAHPTLPIPSLVRVTNLDNGRTVIVRLNDRGPFVDDRIIDMSRAAAGALDMQGPGTARVRVQYVGPAPVQANAAPVSPQLATSQIGQQDIVVRPVPPLVARQPVAQPPALQAPAAGGFYVQAGAFGDLGNANQMRDRLRPIGATSLRPVMVNGSELYRVMVGPWPTRAEADRALQDLAAAGVQAMVVAGTR